MMSEKKRRSWESSHGYVMIFAPKHPKATKLDKYIYEHILVMEEHLGRYLKKGEIVHHRNGIKTDNRIENLQLVNGNREHLGIHAMLRKEQRKDWKCIQCFKPTRNRWYFIDNNHELHICDNCRAKKYRIEHIQAVRKYQKEYSRMRRALGFKK
jgi:hypothetical protein